jgi:tetratricopeptide (TPR) repeat protein
VVVSAIASSLAVHPIAKSFFGQSFEIGTAGFIIILFLALWLIYNIVSHRPERAVGIYVAATLSFLTLEIFHALRFIFGNGFASLGILSTLTSTTLGSWYALSVYSLLVLMITVMAVIFLPLSRGMKFGYMTMAVLAFVGAFFVNDVRIWGAAACVFLGIALYVTFSRTKPDGGKIHSCISRIAWLPTVIFIICAVFAWKGNVIAGPVIGKINASYSEIRLPWQQTLDVGAGVIEDSPVLGAGMNHFAQAYIAHKPAGINSTDAWSVEFDSGFALIPTFFITQGLFGSVAWIVFFVFLGIFGARALRCMPDDPRGRFIIASSYAASVFLWLVLIVSVQPHAIAFLAFIMTGIFLGAAVSHGSISGWTIMFKECCARTAPYAIGACVILLIALGVVYVKNDIALSYFVSGAKALGVANDPMAADSDFSKALAFNDSDVFWQARAQAVIAEAKMAAASVTSTSTASTTQAVTVQVSGLINQSMGYAQKAVAYDPSNYYNYLSEASISAMAASINMTGAYDAAVGAYTRAIQLDPQDPSLYLDLAQFQAQMNKLPDALQTLGVALQVKSNYLDAIYLLSQVEAAQGNLKDAITAAQVAIQINPQSSLLFFQLGLLQYNNAAYSDATTSLEKAISLQSDYSNARYFLGLSYARLNRTSDAIDQFQQLALSNPDNQTIVSIIDTLRSGKSLFATATATTTTTAASAKNSRLPLKEKNQ